MLSSFPMVFPRSEQVREHGKRGELDRYSRRVGRVETGKGGGIAGFEREKRKRVKGRSGVRLIRHLFEWDDEFYYFIAGLQVVINLKRFVRILHICCNVFEPQSHFRQFVMIPNHWQYLQN